MDFPTMKSVKTGSEGNSVSAEASENAKAPADLFAAPSEPIDFTQALGLAMTKATCILGGIWTGLPLMGRRSW